jgi:hypothetical protein
MSNSAAPAEPTRSGFPPNAGNEAKVARASVNRVIFFMFFEWQ